MIIDSAKYPLTWDMRMLKESIKAAKGSTRSIYKGAKLYRKQQGKLTFLYFIIDTEDFYKNIKGQEGKYYDAIQRMKRIEEYVSRLESN